MARTGLRASVLLAIFAALAVNTTAFATPIGRIVIANDEWTLSNSGYVAPNDPDTFAKNVIAWFGGSGKYHAYSNNFGLTQSSLVASMNTATGNQWTTGTGISFDLPTLLTYKGIFVGGPSAAAGAVPNQVLIDYVNAGGNVYVMAGTGSFGGGAAGEAAAWNTFLGAFGLAFGTSYNGIGGSMAISSPHAIFANVDHLFQNNGSDTLDIQATDPRSQVLVSFNGHGLYAVFDGAQSVPGPATLPLFCAGLLSLALSRMRSKPRP